MSPSLPGAPLSDDDFYEIERLFQQAADLPDDERTKFLAQSCGDNPPVREHVERLLAKLADTRAVVPGDGRNWGPFPLAPLVEGTGSTVDRYKLLQVLGEGGFGVVYMAEQQEPVVRKVALKVIKLGMDTREVVARFEAERQALALMDHAHIAKVLDGGVTDSGRPFFVMELVRGISITDYCDQNDLPPRERLQLFVKVCQAVQHAHQKGVIHRDLKPSNVLVTQQDGEAVPKIIDFGVAKAMHTRLTEKTLFTRFEQFVGTPAYMSPEQAQLSTLDVDTRTDIYSLGVLLYELLTGTTPFDTTELSGQDIAGIQRVIREHEPPRPSIRVSTRGDAAVASNRGQDVNGLGRVLRGDLDWVVMKALEKDRNRRYASAGEFGDDVQRYLERQPVVAGPPGTRYRMQRFLVRHRAAVAIAALFAVVLLAGTIGTVSSLFQAQESAQKANDQAERALGAVDFLLSTLALTNPEFALNPDVTVLTLLDHTSREVGSQFADDPAVEARVRAMIGRAYRRLGKYELAEPHLRRALELISSVSAAEEGAAARLATAGFTELEHYYAAWALTNVAFNLERPDSFAVAAYARRVGLDYVALEHEKLADQLRSFVAAVELDAWSREPGAMKQVPRMFEDAKAAVTATFAAGDARWPIIADTFLAAGYAIWGTAHQQLGMEFWEFTLEVQRRELPASHPDTAATVILLVDVWNKRGELRNSENLLLESLEALRSVQREGTLAIATAEGQLGRVYTLQKRYEEAEAVLLRSHTAISKVFGSNSNWLVLESFARVLSLYDAWGQEDRATPFRDQVARASVEAKWMLQWPIQQVMFGPHHARLRQLGNEIDAAVGGAAFIARRGTKTIPDLSDLVHSFTQEWEVALEKDDDRRAGFGRLLIGWANALDPKNHVAERKQLASLAQQGLVGVRKQLPIDYADAETLLSEIARAEGNLSEARQRAGAAWEAMATDASKGTWILGSALVRIARNFGELAMHDAAEPLLKRAYDALEAQLGPYHTDTAEARKHLVRVLNATGRSSEAERYKVPDRPRPQAPNAPIPSSQAPPGTGL